MKNVSGRQLYTYPWYCYIKDCNQEMIFAFTYFKLYVTPHYTAKNKSMQIFYITTI